MAPPAIDVTLEWEFVHAITWAQYIAERITASKGFHDGLATAETDMVAAALVHSEVSEIVEALRHGNQPDDKVPDFLGTEAEMADVVIRLLSWAGRRNWRLGEAVMAKMRFNAGRPRMHGGKRF